MKERFNTFLKKYIPYLRLKNVRIGAALIFALLLILGASSFYKTSPEFPRNTIITIKKGEGLSSVSKMFYEEHVVVSAFWLKALVYIRGGQDNIIAGDYFFHDPTSIYKVAKRITRGDFGLTPIRLTFPEGSNIFEIAATIKKQLPTFDSEDFLVLAKSKEGYLFPDTYLFLPNVKPKEIIEIMEENFAKKIKTINADITTFGKPLADVVIIASILEEEAREMDTRRTIAGILWKRLSIDMPLQVDAAFQYVNGKNTFNLTDEDLAIDSPYNTYRYKGLPPGAITNPGIDAIEAAVTPIKTSYFYYLSDAKGNMHYGKTYDEHLDNRAIYLHK